MCILAVVPLALQLRTQSADVWTTMLLSGCWKAVTAGGGKPCTQAKEKLLYNKPIDSTDSLVACLADLLDDSIPAVCGCPLS